MANHDNVYHDEKLVTANPNQENWRGILTVLLVAVAGLAAVATSMTLLTPSDDPIVQKRRLCLTEVLSGELSPLLFNGSWVSNRHIYYRDIWGGISMLNVLDPNIVSRSLMPNGTFRRLNPVKFSLSPDHQYLLLAQNVKKLFRYSYLAQYVIYDVKTREYIALTPHPEKDVHPYLLLAQWTRHGHGIVMVQDYDIYYRTSSMSNTGYRVTNTAVPGILSNGVPDWLYEEEILHSGEAVWMSPNDHMMLYASFNDSLVEEMHISFFEEKNKILYPDIRSLRYPKPGTPNPLVRLYVADLVDPKNIRTNVVKPPSVIEHIDHYFTTASWVSLTEVCITWLNRPQNLSLVTICKSPVWHCQEIQRITGEGRAWVDTPPEAPLFSTNGSSYVAISPVKDRPVGYSKHIVWVNVLQKQVVPLTQGKFEVVKILVWDQVNNTIYFIGIPFMRPGQRHLYHMNATLSCTGTPLHSAICLTCTVSSDTTNNNESERRTSSSSIRQNNSQTISNEWQYRYEGQTDNVNNKENRQAKITSKNKSKNKNISKNVDPPCQYHNAIFPPESLDYFVLECLGPGVPTVVLYKTEMPAPRLITILQNNTLLRERVASIALPQVKTFPVQISGGYNAQVRLHLPPGFREDEITRYPLVVQVYGAPGSQLVTEMFKVDWNTYLASRKNVIVAQIDGRGSGGQGYKLLYEVYYRLGSVEVADQLEITEYLRDSLHFVDKRRVAVWGWSYGGFVAALVLAHPKQNVFQCGISVAPVVSWELYDSAYAERYMGLPNVTSNYKGYSESNVYDKVKYLHDKMFYLVHGIADDNVQFQQSMTLVHHLAKEGILFWQQVYPDVSHTVAGVNKKHLYILMEQFLENCFQKQNIPAYTETGLGSGGLGGEY